MRIVLQILHRMKQQTRVIFVVTIKFNILFFWYWETNSARSHSHTALLWFAKSLKHNNLYRVRIMYICICEHDRVVVMSEFFFSERVLWVPLNDCPQTYYCMCMCINFVYDTRRLNDSKRLIAVFHQKTKLTHYYCSYTHTYILYRHTCFRYVREHTISSFYTLHFLWFTLIRIQLQFA